MKIAIIGAGSAGLTTAHLLDKTHDITVFEKQAIPGGNVRTLGKNVVNDTLPEGVYVDNGVIEFQRDHFPNFHKLMTKLGVRTEVIIGGSSSIFLANGKHLLGPGVLSNSSESRLFKLYGYAKLMSIFRDYKQLRKTLDQDVASWKHRPISDTLQDNNRFHMWQKMTLMYAYSIPYEQLPDFPAEIAMPLLYQSGMGTRWTRVVDGVFSYMDKIISTMHGDVRCGVEIVSIGRSEDGVEIRLKSGETAQFDKVIFATPPDQVLALLADPTASEQTRFRAWKPNHAETVIHTDLSIYQRYGVKLFSEFDVFEKKSHGKAGYNAYLNRLCGLAETAPHYNLAYNLTERIDPSLILDRQQHHTPLYSAESIRFRDEVIATQGENHTYYAGAWLGNGLHEGAVSSGLALSQLLGGDLL